ncbi:hypothetical protein KQX54_011844 [Cotesia glomerata]|uniref:Uncharacterized protein n=1 Tax=Cotesia glomerata TaxID=32391 RepID=A0AAV7ISE2_COTGL|nr:hypothetical protein KQX54_011844 [Cotesia glomerata]
MPLDYAQGSRRSPVGRLRVRRNERNPPTLFPTSSQTPKATLPHAPVFLSRYLLAPATLNVSLILILILLLPFLILYFLSASVVVVGRNEVGYERTHKHPSTLSVVGRRGTGYCRIPYSALAASEKGDGCPVYGSRDLPKVE